MDFFANFHPQQAGALAGVPLYVHLSFLAVELVALPCAIATLVRECTSGARMKREAGATWLVAALVFTALMLVAVLMHLVGLATAVASLGLDVLALPVWVTTVLTGLQAHLRTPTWFWVQQPYAFVVLQWALVLQLAAHAGLSMAGWPVARQRQRRAAELLARLEQGPEPECAPDTGRRTVRYF